MRFRSFLRSARQTPRKGTGRPSTRALKSLGLERLEDLCLPSFLSPVNYAVGSAPQAVISADFNNDGIKDLAVANYMSGTISVLRGNANGTFQAAITSAAGNGPLSLAAGDFNADGKLDLASANQG